MATKPTAGNYDPSKVAKARVYAEIDGAKGYVRETDKVMNLVTGEILDMPVKNTKPIQASRVPAQCPIIKPQQISTMQNSNVWGLVPQESTTGQKGVARMETPDLNGVRVQIRVGISNGELTDEIFALGDHHGLVADAFTIPTPKGGVTISGSWGANSYVNLKQITGANPMRFHGLHMICTTTAGAASTSFFDNGFLKAVRAPANGDSPQEITIPISDLVQPDSFQTNIRVVQDFRLLMDGFTALYCKIPTGIAVVFNFTYLRSVSESYAMDLVSR